MYSKRYSKELECYINAICNTQKMEDCDKSGNMLTLLLRRAILSMDVLPIIYVLLSGCKINTLDLEIAQSQGVLPVVVKCAALVHYDDKQQLKTIFEYLLPLPTRHSIRDNLLNAHGNIYDYMMKIESIHKTLEIDSRIAMVPLSSAFRVKKDDWEYVAKHTKYLTEKIMGSKETFPEWCV